MKSLVDHLSQSAAYHRDPHNIATQFVGIPLIAFVTEKTLNQKQLDEINALNGVE